MMRRFLSATSLFRLPLFCHSSLVTLWSFGLFSISITTTRFPFEYNFLCLLSFFPLAVFKKWEREGDQKGKRERETKPKSDWTGKEIRNSRRGMRELEKGEYEGENNQQDRSISQGKENRRRLHTAWLTQNSRLNSVSVQPWVLVIGQAWIEPWLTNIASWFMSLPDSAWISLSNASSFQKSKSQREGAGELHHFSNGERRERNRTRRWLFFLPVIQLYRFHAETEWRTTAAREQSRLFTQESPVGTKPERREERQKHNWNK